MQIGNFRNNSYNTSFGQKLVFDIDLISRATREEKSELVLLKKQFKGNGIDGKIQVKNNQKITVRDIIKNLRSEFSQIEFQQQKLGIQDDVQEKRRWWKI